MSLDHLVYIYRNMFSCRTGDVYPMVQLHYKMLVEFLLTKYIECNMLQEVFGHGTKPPKTLNDLNTQLH